MAEEILEMPLDVVMASPGFALDIGGSITKIVYRSKDDFENGKPKDKDKASSGLGILRQKQAPRDNIDDVITFIKNNVDITLDEEGNCSIFSTGVGCNLFQSKIEKELNVQMLNLPEFDCFAEALTLLLKTQTNEQVFHPISKAGVEQSKGHLANVKSFKDGMETTGKGTFFWNDETEDYNVDDDSRFPFLLAMLGSGNGFMKVTKDGKYEFLCGAHGSFGGRFFLGLVGFLTNIKDFEEIAEEIKKSTGRTADTLAGDTLDPNAEGNIYGSLSPEYRLYPLGKGMSEERDKATRGDVIHSMFETICEQTAATAYLTAFAQNIPRVYFTGNFINIPKAQQFLTRTMLMLQKMQGMQVNFEFVKQGGNLGALGAFMEAYNIQRK